MGDYRVIAGVSRTLRTLLEDRMQSSSSPTITLLPPDESPDEGDERVNLFLFRVGEHEQRKNQEFPVHGSASQPSTPPLSLTLHYLLTAHSENSPEKAQRLLGDAMRVLHDYSIITASYPKQQAGSSEGDPVLHGTLQDEYEQIKVSLDPLRVEEMTEIWTAFTVPYRLSAAYSVSVVQIESRRPEGTVRLVGQPPQSGPVVHPVPLDTPRIQEVRVIRQDDPSEKEWRYPYARIGDTLIVRGYNFSGGEDTHVMIGDEEVTGDATIQDSRIEIDIRDRRWLKPGSYSLYVRQDLVERPSPGEPLSYTSNQCFFALIPRVDELQPSSLPASGGTLSIKGKRLYREEDKNVAFVGKPFDEEEFTTATDTEIKLEVPPLDSGEHPVRVRVAGMESILDDATLTIQP